MKNFLMDLYQLAHSSDKIDSITTQVFRWERMSSLVSIENRRDKL
jgi:hypothetical protein